MGFLLALAKDPVPKWTFPTWTVQDCTYFYHSQKIYIYIIVCSYDLIYGVYVFIYLSREIDREYTWILFGFAYHGNVTIPNDFLGPLWSWSHSYCREIQVGQIWTKVAQFLCRAKNIPSGELTYPLPRYLWRCFFLFPRWDMLVDWRACLPIKNDKHILYVQFSDTSHLQ